MAQKLALEGNFNRISELSELDFNLIPEIHTSKILDQENKNIAFTLYQQAIKSKPKNPTFYLRLAKAQIEKGDIERAITTYQLGIEVLPKNERLVVYKNLGDALQKKGRVDEAITSYQEAIELDIRQLKPNQQLVVYKNLGDALQKKGRVDEAITAYEKALQLNTNFVPALLQLALIYEKRKEFDQASTYYQLIVQLQPNNHRAQSGLANVMRCQENIQKV